MTFLVDTSVLIAALRDRSGGAMAALLVALGDEAICVSAFTRMEILAGALTTEEWIELEKYLDRKSSVEPNASSWTEAARIYFELRRGGKTIRNLIDCCIAQLALEHGLRLVHNDRDFEMIAAIRPLDHFRLNLQRV